MSNRSKHQMIALVIGLAALSLGVAAIILRDWSTIEYGNIQLHFGPIKLCQTTPSSRDETATICGDIADFPSIIGQENTFIDEFQILIFTGIGGGFGGLAIFMVAFSCGLNATATLGIGVMAIADVCYIAGLVLFILDDAVNYGLTDEATKHYNPAFYLACASLGCSLGCGSVGKYAIDKRKIST